MHDKWAATARVIYDDRVEQREYDVPRYRRFVRSYKKILSRLQLLRTSQVLDVGCGGGEMTCALKNEVGNIIGVDISAKSLEIARRKNPDNCFILADMTAIPLDGCQFDVITAMTSLEFCFNKTQALSEIHRLLKDDGRFYLEVRNLDFIVFRLTKFANNLLVRKRILIPYKADGFRDLGYAEWRSLLRDANFVILREFPSVRPWNYGSLVTRLKNVVIRMVMLLAPIKNHYMVGFLCAKEQ